MNFTDKLNALKSLARVQAALGGVFISNKCNEETQTTYSTLDNMLIQLRPFLAAENATIIQSRAPSNSVYDEQGRMIQSQREVLITAFVDLATGECIDDVREVQIAPISANFISNQIMSEAETYARKSALKCLFAAHDSDTVPQSDARTLMLVKSDEPSTEGALKAAELKKDVQRAEEEARIADAIASLVAKPDSDKFFKSFLDSKKLDKDMEKFAIALYTQSVKKARVKQA